MAKSVTYKPILFEHDLHDVLADFTPFHFVMVAMVLLVMLAVHVYKEHEKVAGRVWRLLDKILAIFLAVVWFQALDGMSENLFPKQALPSLIHGLVVYALAMFMGWFGQSYNRKHILVLYSCFAHYVSFSAIIAGHHIQEHYFADKGAAQAASVCIPILCVLLIVGKIKRSIADAIGGKSAVWDEATIELGFDVAGMCLAFLLSQAVQVAIVGEFQSIEKQCIEHDWGARNKAMVYAAGISLLLVMVVPTLDAAIEKGGERHRGYIPNLAAIFKNVLTMMTAWSYVFCLQWIVMEHAHIEHLSPAARCFGTAILVSLFTALTLLVEACLSPDNWLLVYGDGILPNTIHAVFALVCGWSWGWGVDNAIHIYASGHTHWSVSHRLQLKVNLELAAAILLSCVILPIYMVHVKPRAMVFEEEEEKKRKFTKKTDRTREDSVGSESATTLSRRGETEKGSVRRREATPVPRAGRRVED